MTMLKNTIPAFKDARKGKVWCLVVAPNVYSKNPQNALGIAVLGEAGYTPLSPKFGASDNYGALSAIADEINLTELGLSPETTVAIVADTMHRSEFKRDQDEGLVTLKFRRSELEYMKRVISEDMDCILASCVFQPVLDRISDEIDNIVSELRG